MSEHKRRVQQYRDDLMDGAAKVNAPDALTAADLLDFEERAKFVRTVDPTAAHLCAGDVLRLIAEVRRLASIADAAKRYVEARRASSDFWSIDRPFDDSAAKELSVIAEAIDAGNLDLDSGVGPAVGDEAGAKATGEK